MTNKEFRDKASTIPYQYRHPFMLYALVKWLNVESVIEIGCHIGMTSVWLARALKENAHGMLYCIDPFCWTNENQEQQWRTNIALCEVEEHVTLLKGRSQEVPWPLTEMVFVDGNHTYSVARHDAEKARDQGARCIVLHDTVAWEGSRKHADEIRNDPAWAGWDKLEAMFDCGLMILLRREPKGPCEGEDIGEKWDKPAK